MRSSAANRASSPGRGAAPSACRSTASSSGCSPGTARSVITLLPPGASPGGLDVAGLLLVPTVRRSGPEVPEQHREAVPAAGRPALHRALLGAEHGGGLGDRHALHVDQHHRGALGQREPGERLLDGERGDPGGHRVARHGDVGVVVERVRPVVAPAADPVEAGVQDDLVQPGGHRGLAAPARGGPEGREHRVLEGVRRVVRVAEGAHREGPEPVGVAPDDLGEGVRVAVDVRGEQRLVGARIGHGPGR